MPHATCAHCNVPINDHSTMVTRGSQAYCCNNCAQMASGTPAQMAGGATCAHCHSTISDPTTQVVRGGQTYCCNNCAMAMVPGASRR